jgi:hypothetical protein
VLQVMRKGPHPASQRWILQPSGDQQLQIEGYTIWTLSQLQNAWRSVVDDRWKQSDGTHSRSVTTAVARHQRADKRITPTI